MSRRHTHAHAAELLAGRYASGEINHDEYQEHPTHLTTRNRRDR